MAHITGQEVRARLRTLTEIDISDETLAQAPYIPAGDAWLDVILGNGGKEFSSLGDNEAALAKSAEIAFVAHKVISCAPVRGSKTGPVEIKPVPQQDKERICKLLKKEWRHYLQLIGCSTEDGWWTGHFGSAYYD